MRNINMIILVLKEPIAAGHQLAHHAARRWCALALRDLFRQPLAELLVQGPHQLADAVRAHRGIRKLLSTGQGDGATDAIALQDPIKALTGMRPLVKRDLDQLLALVALRSEERR